MVESILKSSLKRHAKKQNVDSVKDISIGIVLNENEKPVFYLLVKGNIVSYKERQDYPVSELLGMIDYAKYEAFNGSKILSKNIIKHCEENKIDLEDVFILIFLKDEKIKIKLFKDKKIVKSLKVEDFI